MKAPNWLQFGPNVDNSTAKSYDMYDNIIARDKTSNTNIKETKNSHLGTNKCSTNVNQRTISDENNKSSVLHSNVSLDLSNEKKRPLSISSVSSSSSSSCSSLTRNGSLGLGDTKKSYLASIESLDDADEDTDDDSLGIIRMIRAKVNGCASLSAAAAQLQSGSPNQQSHHSSHSQSLQPIPLVPNSQNIHEQQPIAQPSEPVLNNITCRNGTLPKYLDTNLSHIDRVIVEIVETERTYVKDLQEIIEGYLKHMKSLDESKLNKEEMSHLFSNIEDIFKFNSNFFSQLDECGLNAVSIAKCFIQNSSGFNIYTHYCTNYPRTVSLLTEMMRDSDRAELFKERQLTLKHSLPLGSYLLKPVQRILKYHLLLQNIVKYTDKDSNDYIDIKNALSVMTNIAYHINDMKRKHEHAVRVQEIQSLLYNWEGQDLTTYGDLQCEGSFRMFGAKAYRHLFLFDKMLLITKKKDEGILSFKTHILCSNLMLIESIQGEPLCFHAIPFDQPRAQYTFQARNLEQKREWCLLLKRVILENYNVVIPSHAKQIVMELGQSIHCHNEKGHSGSKRTLSAPEYLERRKQERRKSELTINQNLSKGFKLRKSLKKIHYMDGNNGSRRARSSSHDESVRTLSKQEDNSERRASLGIMELINDKTSGEKFESNATNALTTTPSKPVNQTGSTTNSLTEEKANNDVENPIHLSNNILDMRPPPRTFRAGQKELNEVPNDSNGEYVTFYISSNNEEKCSNFLMSNSSSTLYNRTSTPLSSGSSELSMASMASSSQSEDSKYVVLPVNALLSYTNHTSSPIVRRVQSFTGMTRAKAILQHTLSLRHSLTSDLPPTSPHKRILQRPTTLNLSNCSSSSQLPTSSSLDEMSPTAPAIWLKRQEQHFASSACKKGGSLPRSFESTKFGETNDDNSKTSSSTRSRHTPHSDQRPFTIAADKPLNGDFSDGNLERYIDMENQCLTKSTSQDDMLKGSDNSPSMSLENVSTNEVHHPEHKIYKHSASKYIRSMIYSVSSKLVSLRRSPTSSDHGGDNSSIISGESMERCESPASLTNRINNKQSNKANESKHEISPKLITARFVHTLAKAYSNIIKHKLKSSDKNDIDLSASKALAEIPSPVFARIAMPTTSSVAAARMAAYDNEECYGMTPKHRCGLRNKISGSRQRPDSLLSETSNVSSEGTDRSVISGSSFTSDYISFEKHDSLPLNVNDISINDDSPSDASDSSIDSFYERTFEAIESALAEEMFGDSAIYSDGDDQDISSANCNEDYIDNHLSSISPINMSNKTDIYKSIEHLKCVNLNLLSAKRVKGAIIEKLKVLEESARFQKDMNINDFDGIKTIKERMEELEKWCSYKENIDEIDDEHYAKRSPKGSPKPNTKGWVKHVIGKLQNDGQNVQQS